MEVVVRHQASLAPVAISSVAHMLLRRLGAAVPRRFAGTTPAGACGVTGRLAALGIELPATQAPRANFLPYVRTGNLVYVSGQIPRRADGSVVTGTVGRDVDVPAAQDAAQLTTVNLLAQIRAACEGDFRRVRKIVRIEGFVKATEDFDAHPEVVNGCSDLMVAAFGADVGAHTRFAVGAPSLPRGVPVEICCVFEIAD